MNTEGLREFAVGFFIAVGIGSVFLRIGADPALAIGASLLGSIALSMEW